MNSYFTAKDKREMVRDYEEELTEVLNDIKNCKKDCLIVIKRLNSKTIKKLKELGFGVKVEEYVKRIYGYVSVCTKKNTITWNEVNE